MSTKPQSENTSLSDRISFVDVMRGVAVVSMIWMHTADGWLDRSYRAGAAWRPIVAFGGLAAPLFFALSGVGLALAWHGTARDRLATRLRAQTGRGLQLVVLGYALRVQMWIVDAGGYRRLTHWVAAICLLGGYVLAHRALRPRVEFDWRSWVGSASLCGGAFFYVHVTEPARLVGLLRVDVLQGIGMSIALVCVLCRVRPALVNSPTALAVLATLIAVTTGTVRHWLPGPVPVPLAGYVAAWPLAPDVRATTLFPLMPWSAYVFAGAAFAVAWNRWRGDGDGKVSLAYVSVASALAAYLIAEPQRWIHAAMSAWPEATHLFRVSYRLAVIGAMTYPALAIALSLVGKGLRQLGTASLWIYWIHLEFAFGSAAHPIKHQLHTVGWLVGFAVLTAAMTALAFAINAQVGVRWFQSVTLAWTRRHRT